MYGEQRHLYSLNDEQFYIGMAAKDCGQCSTILKE